jgi:release factor glutamine methyltransferase
MTSNGTMIAGRRRLVNAAAAVLERAGIESPRLDAEVLLAAVLGVPRLELLLKPSERVAQALRRRFSALVRSRARHEPVAYLVGAKEFYGRPFGVDRRVLVPRPETEVLARAAAGWLEARPTGRRRVLDLCTGSGCLAVTIALEVPGAEVLATDVSESALEVARANVSRLGAAGVSLGRGDLYEAPGAAGPFDLIVSNPPYVARSELGSVDRSVRDFEPEQAWLSGDDPLAFHRRILQGARGRLRQDGAIMLEVGSGASELVGLISDALPEARGSILMDLDGHARVIVADRSHPPTSAAR